MRYALVLAGAAAATTTGSAGRNLFVPPPDFSAPAGASKVVDHAFVSWSFPAHFFTDYIGQPGVANLFSRDVMDLMFNTTGKYPVIRLGGTSTDRLTLIHDQKEAAINDYSSSLGVPDHVYIGPSFFELFKGFPNTHWDFQAVLANNTQAGLENTLEVTKRVKDVLGNRLNLVEVGNEPTGYTSWCRPKTYKPADYVREWKTRSDSISKEVFGCTEPHTACWENFQGLVLIEYNGYTVKGLFADGINESGHLKSISLHYYAGDFHKDPTLGGVFMNHTERVSTMNRFIDNWRTIKENNPDVELVLGETNMWSNSHGQAALETVFGSALFYVDYCMYGMSQSISRYNIIQGTDRDHASWVAVPYKGQDPHFKPNMYGQLFAATAIGRHDDVRVKHIDMGLDHFSAYGVYEGNELKRYVLTEMTIWNTDNPECRRSRSIHLVVPLGVRSVTVRRLSGHGTNVSEGITLGGLYWESENQRLVQRGQEHTETIPVVAGTVKVVMKWSEAAIVSFD